MKALSNICTLCDKDHAGGSSYHTPTAAARQEDWSGRVSVPKLTCPTCGSHAIKRMGTGKKVALVGVLAPLVRTFKCRSCGGKWG